MFNNLAAYLLGTTSSATTSPRTPSNNLPTDEQQQPLTLYRHHNTHQQQLNNSDNQRNSIRLNNSTAILHVDVSDEEEDEDDWVLVDRELAQSDNRDSEGNSTLESSSEEESDNEQSPTKIINHHLLHPRQQPTPTTTTDYDITHLLLNPSTTTQSPIHSSSSYHILQPSAYTLTTLASPTPVTSTLPTIVNTMEESWFLTPPPCFTSTGPVHMETSPLENLLIEHPSMSVYQNVIVGGMLFGGNRAGRGGPSSGNSSVETLPGNSTSNISAKQSPTINDSNSTTTTVVLLEEVSSDLEDDAEALLFEVDEEVERGYLRAAQQQQRRRRGNGQRGYNRVATGEVTRYQQRQERQMVVEQQRHEGQGGQQGVRNKQAQKVQIHKACQSLKRSYLERNNKAREVNFRNQRLRRGERSQGSTRSNANNNRKCS